MRFVERIKARKFSGHVEPKPLFRLPHVMFSDYRARHRLTKELGHASKKAHDRFLVAAHKDFSNSYDVHLAGYVLSYMSDDVRSRWEKDGFSVMLVSERMMASSFSNLARRNGQKVTRNQRYTTSGMYVPFAGVIYVKEGTVPFQANLEKYCWQNTEDICGHEIGHYVDEVFDYPSVTDNLFLEAYRCERHRLDSYSASDNREYFATCCWICRRYPKIARRFLPQTYHYFRVLFDYK